MFLVGLPGGMELMVLLLPILTFFFLIIFLLVRTSSNKKHIKSLQTEVEYLRKRLDGIVD